MGENLQSEHIIRVRRNRKIKQSCFCKKYHLRQCAVILKCFLCELYHSWYHDQCLFYHSHLFLLFTCHLEDWGSSHPPPDTNFDVSSYSFDSPSSISELIGRLFFMSGNLMSVHDKVCLPCEDTLWINDLSVNKLCIMSAQVFHLSLADDHSLDGHFMWLSCVACLTSFSYQ